MIRARSIDAGSSPPEREARPGLASWYMPGLSDGLGDRLLMFDNTAAASLELLRFRRELGDSPRFEAALRQRLEDLAHFTHPSIATVRTVQRLDDNEGLALVSNHVAGRRLSEVLREARGPKLAVELIRQLTPVLASMHQQGDGIAHGAVSAERIVVTPEGRLVIVEHVLGSALAALHLPADSLRSELGLPMPPGGDFVALDGRTDVAQLAFVALSLLLGRRVDPREYAGSGPNLLDEFAWGDQPGFPAHPELRRWLERALQMTSETFDSAQDAQLALGEFLEVHEPPAEKTPRALYVLHPPAESSAAPTATPMPDILDNTSEFLGEEEVGKLALSRRTTRPVAVKPVSATAAAMPADHRRDARISKDPAPMTLAPATEANGSIGDAVFKWAEETTDVAPPRTVSARRADVTRWVLAGCVVLAVAEGGAIAALMRVLAPVSPVAVTIDSPQPGSEVVVNGQRVGVTPFKVALASGMRSIQVLSPEGHDPAAPAAGAVASAGRLEVTSDPPGARVVVDGTRRGVTPLKLPIQPGKHAVVLSHGTRTATRTVNVAAGGTATVMVALGSAGTAAAAGWLSFSGPPDLQVSEGGSLLGTTSAARLMLPAGRHNLELSNAALGFRTVLSVDVQAGKTVSATVAVPTGSLSINALPWANVWLDGRALGTTPLANLEVPMGTHEIVWRHPQLGERRQTVVVPAKAPVRVGMDLSK